MYHTHPVSWWNVQYKIVVLYSIMWWFWNRTFYPADSKSYCHPQNQTLTLLMQCGGHFLCLKPQVVNQLKSNQINFKKQPVLFSNSLIPQYKICLSSSVCNYFTNCIKCNCICERVLVKSHAWGFMNVLFCLIGNMPWHWFPREEPAEVQPVRGQVRTCQKL